MKKRSTMIALLLAACTVMTSGMSTTVFAEEEHDPITVTWINCYNPCFVEGPWGGYKMSGIGRDLGVHGLEEYQEVKQINDCLNPGLPSWYTN